MWAFPGRFYTEYYVARPASMHVIVMPKAGQTMEEGAVLRWHKKEGERVQAGEVLLEVETDKAIAAVISEMSGVLRRILIPEGNTVPVLTLLAYVGGAEEEFPPETSGHDIKDVITKPLPTTNITGGQSDPQRVSKLVSPRARKLASEHGIDPELLTGTGAEGRVTEEDVRLHLDRRQEGKTV